MTDEPLAAIPVDISAVDGFALKGHLYDPGLGPAAPLVIVNCAVGVRQSYYAHLARYLAAQGLVCLTYDYRGIGQSRAEGQQLRMVEWGTHDFEGVLRWAAAHHPGRPIRVVGHSIGGWVLGFAESNAAIDGAITFCAGIPDWRRWDMPQRIAAMAFWYGLMPGTLALFGRIPHQLFTGSDLPRGIARQWITWCQKRDSFVGEGEFVQQEWFLRLRCPVVVAGFQDDVFAPRGSVDALAGLFGAAEVVRQDLKPRDLGVSKIGHVGFFHGRNSKLWDPVARWLHAPAPRPVFDTADPPVRPAADDAPATSVRSAR